MFIMVITVMMSIGVMTFFSLLFFHYLDKKENQKNMENMETKSMTLDQIIEYRFNRDIRYYKKRKEYYKKEMDIKYP